jgi:hypothetical protein
MQSGNCKKSVISIPLYNASKLNDHNENRNINSQVCRHMYKKGNDIPFDKVDYYRSPAMCDLHTKQAIVCVIST